MRVERHAHFRVLWESGILRRTQQYAALRAEVFGYATGLADHRTLEFLRALARTG